MSTNPFTCALRITYITILQVYGHSAFIHHALITTRHAKGCLDTAQIENSRNLKLYTGKEEPTQSCYCQNYSSPLKHLDLTS